MTASIEKKDFPLEIPFVRELGAEFVKMENGESEVSLLVEPRHCNSWGVAHGGVVMTLLDVTMSMAARSLGGGEVAGMTIEMKTSFIQPAGSAGRRITGRARVTHAGKSMVFCESAVWAGDKLAARAMGTVKLIRRLEAAKRLDKP